MTAEFSADSSFSASYSYVFSSSLFCGKKFNIKTFVRYMSTDSNKSLSRKIYFHKVKKADAVVDTRIS